MARAQKGLAYLTCFDLKPKGRQARSLELKSIIAPHDREFDPNTMVMFYGAQSTLREMAKIHAQAISNGQDLYQIAVGVEVTKIIVEFLTLEDLKNTRMMNMERISKEVQSKIQEYWYNYLKAEGKSEEWITDNVEWRSHRYMSDRPDLVAKLAKEKEFKHLSLIAFQMVYNNTIYKVGMILDKKAIRDVKCKTHSNVPVAMGGKVVSADNSAKVTA